MRKPASIGSWTKRKTAGFEGYPTLFAAAITLLTITSMLASALTHNGKDLLYKAYIACRVLNTLLLIIGENKLRAVVLIIQFALSLAYSGLDRPPPNCRDSIEVLETVVETAIKMIESIKKRIKDEKLAKRLERIKDILETLNMFIIIIKCIWSYLNTVVVSNATHHYPKVKAKALCQPRHYDL